MKMLFSTVKNYTHIHISPDIHKYSRKKCIFGFWLDISANTDLLLSGFIFFPIDEIILHTFLVSYLEYSFIYYFKF